MHNLNPNTFKLKFNTGPIQSFLNLIINYNKENLVVAEIGTYVGATSVYAAQIVKEKKGKYIAVDHFIGSDVPDKGEYTPHSKHNLKEGEVLQQFRKNIDSVECTDITTIYPMTSLEAAEKIDDESLDICFIDACHGYSSVKNDIIAYLPKLKKGGIICGHDFEKGSHLLINQIKEDELEMDYIFKLVRCYTYAELAIENNVFSRKLINWTDSALWFHPGVTKAVSELFSKNNTIEITDDNVWIVKL